MFKFLLNLGKSKPILLVLLMASSTLLAQQIEITGQVFDETGLPLPGATIILIYCRGFMKRILVQI